jgi:hypothetical protein
LCVEAHEPQDNGSAARIKLSLAFHLRYR